MLASPTLTPGSLNPDVTQATIGSTICVRGWTATVRPPTGYTNALKLEQMPEYGETGAPSGYQEDHLISLELGGNPTDPSQPLARALPAGSRRRQDRERAERQGLLGRAHPGRGAAAGVRVEARARVRPVRLADARVASPRRGPGRTRPPRCRRRGSRRGRQRRRREGLRRGRLVLPDDGRRGPPGEHAHAALGRGLADRDPGRGRGHSRDRRRGGERPVGRARPVPAPLDGLHRRREVHAVDRPERLRLDAARSRRSPRGWARSPARSRRSTSSW